MTTESVKRKTISNALSRLISGRKITSVSTNVAHEMRIRRKQFDRERIEIEDKIKDGAKLTKHRISL